MPLAEVILSHFIFILEDIDDSWNTDGILYLFTGRVTYERCFSLFQCLDNTRCVCNTISYHNVYSNCLGRHV